MGKIPATHPPPAESSFTVKQGTEGQQLYEEYIVPIFASELSIDSTISVPEEEFLGAPGPSAVSSDDGSSLLDPPPAYGPFPQDMIGGVNYDGRIDFEISSSARHLSKLFASGIRKQIGPENGEPPPFSSASVRVMRVPTPRMNIVIQVVGSRGDAQPFVSLGLTLQKFGHRIRLATHPTFQRFVEGSGLEFFSIGGDPAELMAYMVKNPGLMPRFGAFRQGEIQRRRRAMRDIMRGCWRSCFETGDGLGDHTSPSTTNRKRSNTGSTRYKEPQPFVADAIIANPPSFAHVHCAEKLGIPLHLMFTMPWSPTQAFAHPLANIRSSDTDMKMANYLSYIFVEMMTWQGLGDVINRFRYKTLGLERIHPTWAPGMISRLRIPYTYCWSPELIPKPKDWGSNIAVAGFFFLPLALTYNAPSDLLSFIEGGPRPIYIGFGSIVVDDPRALTNVIFEAVRLAGVRAIVSKGWSNLGGSEREVTAPPNIFMLGDCPHDWLFGRVSCVVHHGGAGTTAAGIAAGKPTVVVPFFGDQPFWGDMIYRASAGPRPIPFKVLSAAALADAITTALQPEIQCKARELGDRVKQECGSETGLRSFHDQLPIPVIGCALAPRRVAVWQLRKRRIRLSAVAAVVLRKEGLLDFGDLEPYRPCQYDLDSGPWEPVSGATLAVLDLFYDTFKGIGEIGSEFVRVPYVGQKRTVHSPQNQTPISEELLPAAVVPTPSPSYSLFPDSKDGDGKFVGLRAAKGLGRIVKAAARAPGTFTVAMAQGAHNAPRIWGDKTVRQQDKVTGVVSGVTAGCKELALGTYDGIAGLITQPVIGAMEEGPLGFVKGFGKGVMGTPFKFWAGMSGIVGYSLKGVDAEVTKAFRADSAQSIKSSRIAQGEREYLEASEEERRGIVDRWHEVLAEEQFRKAQSKRKGKEEAEVVDVDKPI